MQQLRTDLLFSQSLLRRCLICLLHLTLRHRLSAGQILTRIIWSRLIGLDARLTRLLHIGRRRKTLGLPGLLLNQRLLNEFLLHQLLLILPPRCSCRLHQQLLQLLQGQLLLNLARLPRQHRLLRLRRGQLLTQHLIDHRFLREQLLHIHWPPLHSRISTPRFQSYPSATNKGRWNRRLV